MTEMSQPEPNWSSARAAAIVDHSLTEARAALDSLLARPGFVDDLVRAGDLVAESLSSGGRVFSCGNGGSLCDAMHFAEELSGRFRGDRPALAATAIADSAHLTCTANDYGYEAVFSRYVEAHGRKDDILLAISTSGGSTNVVRAAKAARDRGMKTIALTGRENCPLAELADVHLSAPGGRFSDRVQELHIKMIHILIELVEARMFSAAGERDGA